MTYCGDNMICGWRSFNFFGERKSAKKKKTWAESELVRLL